MLAASTTMVTGDTYFVNSQGIFQRLPAGTNGQVLTLAAGIPTYATPSTYISNQFPTVIALSTTTPTATCTGNNNIIFTLTMTGNTTFAIAGAQVGQILMFEVTQGSGTTYTNTWFSTITWATPGGTAPVETTTSSGITVYGFRVLSASTFLGFLVGNN